MASELQVAKTIKALRNKHSVARVVSLNRWSRAKLDALIDTTLPKRYRNNTAIRNLVIDLALGRREDGTKFVRMSSRYLKNSYESLYLPSRNKLPGKSGKSILAELIHNGIILTDGRYIVGKKPHGYRLPETFPVKVKNAISQLYLANQVELADKSNRDVDNDLTLAHTLARNEVINAPDDYTISEEQRPFVECTGLTKVIIEDGYLGNSFVARDLLIECARNLLFDLAELDKLLESSKQLFSHQTGPQTATLTTAPAHQHIGKVPVGGLVSFDNPLHIIHGCIDGRAVQMVEIDIIAEKKNDFETQLEAGFQVRVYPRFINHDDSVVNVVIPVKNESDIELEKAKMITDYLDNTNKFVAFLGGTSETCEKGGVLIHKAELKLSYTGRAFELKGLGTTGLKTTLKSQNYDFITELTGQEVFNYDLRGSQVAGILHYGDLYGFKFPHLEWYVSDKSIRTQLAKEVGIPEKLLKVLVLIKMFGGKNSYSFRKDSYPEAFRKAGYSESENKRLINKFNIVCKDVLSDIDIWFTKLIPIVLRGKVCSETKYSNGVTVVDQSFLSTAKMQSAFLLQGLEAEFIFALILCSRLRKSSFYLLSYEFDGLITLGAIPGVAIVNATRITGFKRAVIEIKEI